MGMEYLKTIHGAITVGQVVSFSVVVVNLKKLRWLA